MTILKHKQTNKQTNKHTAGTPCSDARNLGRARLLPMASMMLAVWIHGERFVGDGSAAPFGREESHKDLSIWLDIFLSFPLRFYEGIYVFTAGHMFICSMGLKPNGGISKFNHVVQCSILRGINPPWSVPLSEKSTQLTLMHLITWVICIFFCWTIRIKFQRCSQPCGVLNF